MPRGKYIVIEGNDGTGKSTQVEHLADWLKAEKGIDSFVTHEPDGPGISAEIRKIIKNGELERDAETNLLLFTASRHEMWQRARKELELGKWVLSARNYLSTIVYQGYGEGSSVDQITSTTRQFTDDLYMNPDHTIILSLSKDVREKRIGERGELEMKDTFESKGDDFQAKLDSGYQAVAELYNYPVIEAEITIDQVQNLIRKILNLS